MKKALTPEYIIALENLRSLYNIGAIIRTCEFFGINKVLLIGYSGVDKRFGENEIHKKIHKTSLGTIEKIFIEHYIDISEVKQNYKKFSFIGIENNIEGTQNIRNWKETIENTIIILGNEIKGIESETLSECNKVYEIERIGTHSSLNVATCCGIVLNHIVNLSKNNRV